MSFTTILLAALALSMDAFAVAVSNGIRTHSQKAPEALRIGFFFGLFQGLMPIIGFYLANGFNEAIKAFDHWIAFVLLFIIGGKMLYEAFFTPDTCDVNTNKAITLKELLFMSIATSIDAMAVGISFSALYPEHNILFSSSIIAVTTFLISATGVLIGKQIGCFLQKKAEAVGGFILIGIGVKILFEHLFSIN